MARRVAFCFVFIAILAKFGPICYNKEKGGTAARRLPLHSRIELQDVTAFLVRRGGYFLFIATINPVTRMSENTMSYKVITPTSFPFRDKKVKK